MPMASSNKRDKMYVSNDHLSFIHTMKANGEEKDVKE